MTAVHLSAAEYARLFPEPPHDDNHTAPTVTLPATAVIADTLPASPAPLQPVTMTDKHTPTYDALRGLLALSASIYGAPNVARVTGGYAIRIGDRLAVGVTITEPLTTILSWQHYDEATKAWTYLEQRRMTKLAPKEFLALFVTGKALP